MSKQEWGNSTWFLFHGLATKVKPEYNEEYKNILQLFVEICNFLPCPDCKQHAVHTNRTARFERIRSNQSLKEYFWSFHNLVNVRLRKPHFTMEQHDNLYNTVKIPLLLPPFYKSMTAKVPPPLMMEAFHRKKVVTKIINYVKQNMHKYNS